MNVDILSFTTVVFVATFSPGPGNISSAGMGMKHGYKGTILFIAGIVAGYCSVMIFSAFLSSSLLHLIPNLEPLLKILGTGYLLWLACGILKDSSQFSAAETTLRFRHGFLIQALNPKAIIFGMTIYTSLLSGISDEPYLLILSILFLTLVTFLSVSLWALGGARIRIWLYHPRARKAANVILSLLLLFCALSISGILNFF